MSLKTATVAKLSLARTFRVSPSFTDEAILRFLEGIHSPRSLSVWILYKYKEFSQLVDLDIEPEHYNDPVRFRDDYTATLFLSKSDFLPLAVSKKDAAFKKFFVYEDQCRRTNSLFRSPSLPLHTKGANAWLLNATKRKIEMILGDFSPEEFVNSAYWGPGVSTLMKGEDVSAVNKFQSETGITPDLDNFISPWIALAYPTWLEHVRSRGGFKHQMGNEVVTVPKNSKTDRVIAIEPGWNLWFQKGCGAMIRRRLARVGIDLNSQERNQQLAQEGSSTALLATVDFSSASDSISTSIVRELLPARWFSLLNVCRSKIGVDAENRVIRWEKFSSMGNGFTFELESLIFYAAALAVCESESVPTDQVSVFGDDVIIPNSAFTPFADFSAYLGFTVNTSKSFHSSYFRESCGSHYFNGSDCKPIFLKKKLSNVQTVYKLANSIRMLAHRRNSHHGCDRRLRTCWVYLYSGVPKPLRLGTTFGVGDSAFVVNFDEATPSLAHQNPRFSGFEGYLVESLVEVAVTRPFDDIGLLLARVSRGSEREYGNTYTLRGRTRTRIQRVLVPRWYNLGEWA